jgi:hypothetical protein
VWLQKEAKGDRASAAHVQGSSDGDGIERGAGLRVSV